MKFIVALGCLVLLALPAAAQQAPPPAQPPAGEDCGCGVPSSPRGPR
ncbi:hypothetical protein [Falsiroseomonas tokyonensis]|uniref:Uncharacterized protein n=1 Tax=Falsiroseomonas tokyonensis TaxID=430521 RepID=A0ABV7BSZ1_9PROT|nr:hypothetical protein [Falsiroseomonas tokyonensis]MBU8537796.1 hypothetical protein [Falsiroseomonas tokyonensis]